MTYADDEWEQDCRVCKRPDKADLRKRWGCDEECEPRRLSCVLCPADDPDPACQVCAGTGEWALNRCPNAYAGDEARRVVTAAGMIEIGVLPASGGWDEQTALFHQAAGLALRERREADDARRDQEVRRGRK